MIVDTWYDAKGQVRKQSVPYAVATGSGYRSPASQPFTTTTYDALGRTLVVTAPDNSDQEYQYPATPAESQYATYQETKYYDANNNLTRTLSDVWGRVRVVIPAHGASVTYTYDEADA